MQRKFERVAIVNRGEAAMRFIHAAREFNLEHGTSLRTIALYTDSDRNAMFVRQADESVSLGPPQIADPNTNILKSRYVDNVRLERALRQARAEAVWVGWGFAGQHAGFADLCRDMGIVFIGPDGDVMRRVGDKIEGEITLYDTDVYVKPIHAKMNFERSKETRVELSRPYYNTCTDTNGPSAKVFMNARGFLDERAPGDPLFWDETDPRPWGTYLTESDKRFAATGGMQGKASK